MFQNNQTIIWNTQYICTVRSLKDWSTLFVCIEKWKDTGQVLILWSVKRFSKSFTKPVSIHFPMQTEKVHFNPFIYAKATKTS